MDIRIKNLSDLFSANNAVEKLILFGSRARGDFSKNSDIDIAISCPNAKFSDLSYFNNILDNPPTLLSIDLVDYDRLDNNFKNKINQEGVVLYEKR
jgi:predicted nucleotidyltransferase